MVVTKKENFGRRRGHGDITTHQRLGDSGLGLSVYRRSKERERVGTHQVDKTSTRLKCSFIQKFFKDRDKDYETESRGSKKWTYVVTRRVDPGS